MTKSIGHKNSIKKLEFQWLHINPFFKRAFEKVYNLELKNQQILIGENLRN